MVFCQIERVVLTVCCRKCALAAGGLLPRLTARPHTDQLQLHVRLRCQAQAQAQGHGELHLDVLHPQARVLQAAVLLLLCTPILSTRWRSGHRHHHGNGHGHYATAQHRMSRL